MALYETAILVGVLEAGFLICLILMGLIYKNKTLAIGGFLFLLGIMVGIVQWGFRPHGPVTVLEGIFILTTKYIFFLLGTLLVTMAFFKHFKHYKER